ncbi:hypothetical protein ACHHYP_11195 [Achlya hypogyna]|uniref:Uncharacterized protein n=1 Tax=Achlya hypogyna TaxID=1202772 RepID=A0A1V9YJK9_ACHHY|nr:hypothetical protein ACHHYP_11195 [Achlya hypogyna]
MVMDATRASCVDETTSEESCDEVPAVAERRLKRDKQRDFRRKVSHQLEFLRSRVAALQTSLRAARAEKAMRLPWAEVAKAMRQDVVATKGKRKALLAQVEDHVELAEAMYKWVQSLSPERPLSKYPVWFSVGLCGNDISRRAAMDWITQHMYYHTPTILHLAGFRPDMQMSSQEFVFDTSKGYIEYVYTDRRFHRAALHQVLAAYQRLYYANSVDFVVAGRKVMDQGDGMIYSRREPKNENVVHREFVSDDRIVHVQHSIHDDSRHPLGAVHRHRTAWIVLDVVGPNVVMETKVFHKSQSWTVEKGYVSLEEEADIVGYFDDGMDRDDFAMLPTSVQENHLRRHMGTTFPRCMNTLNCELEQAMAQLHLEDAASFDTADTAILDLL